jgi:hypothetical protein
MNFIEAVKLMRRGKLMQRKNNSFDHYFCLYTDDDKDEIVSYFLDGKVQATEWVFSLSDIEANDWIILDDYKRG